MNITDFDYDLPEELIAQHPLEDRAGSRLMTLDRASGAVRHLTFSAITGLLKPGDVLVLNDTKVVPARLFAKKATGGKVEMLLVREERVGVWECMLKNSKGLKLGMRLFFDTGGAACITGESGGLWQCRFEGVDPWELMERTGSVPLPPYIRREPSEADRGRYQTVFAGPKGAVAAPTAGLHFTETLLDNIRAMGVEVLRLTLHTGPGTFLPVRVDDITAHRMHKEHYSISRPVFDAVIRAKAGGRRVIAVGTTTTRALEAAVLNGFDSPALEGSTDIFIYPGFVFKVIDGLLTNFHLPSSTLLMLVCAFAGHKNVMAAYKEAVDKRYRFFSYGDAMFIAS
ncbi:MAG: tRNA preQ1(34) S-adenosylmethionine ribosyltransferase-isomerase QueA [Deltaproteobacteria bacterium RIFCSPLOWO2_02_FULL_53_8]|nr:MAG: tRNA preQ1(34) S-adenosylmethionine ribosyltransferase-isomerase QueA [Deltaproteobacteria bacterium RIFCSPLOWO2_02_FULL_53_8]